MDPNDTLDLRVTYRQFCAILAALRLYQATPPALSIAVEDIATDGGRFEPLDEAGIDDLIFWLNDGKP